MWSNIENCPSWKAILAVIGLPLCRKWAVVPDCTDGGNRTTAGGSCCCWIRLGLIPNTSQVLRMFFTSHLSCSVHAITYVFTIRRRFSDGYFHIQDTLKNKAKHSEIWHHRFLDELYLNFSWKIHSLTENRSINYPSVNFSEQALGCFPNCRYGAISPINLLCAGADGCCHFNKLLLQSRALLFRMIKHALHTTAFPYSYPSLSGEASFFVIFYGASFSPGSF